jgi:hypothetical protein
MQTFSQPQRFWRQTGWRVGSLAIAISLLTHPAVAQAQAAQTVELDRNGAVKAIPFERTQSTIYTHTQFYDSPYPVVYYPPYPYTPFGLPPGTPYSNPAGIHNSILVNPTLVNTPIYNSTLINPRHVRTHAFPPPLVQYGYPARNQFTFPRIQYPQVQYPQVQYPQVRYPESDRRW